jgi:hypothetical protein
VSSRAARAANNDVLLVNANMHAQLACHHLGEFHEAQKYAADVRALAPRACPAERIISILDPVVASLAESSRNRYLARS